jgi:ferrochelatase
MEAKKGVLLINLGTPEAPTKKAVRRYLKEFLSDPFVIDIPGFFRFLLLRLFILPFRPRKSARAYQEIWTKEGSPLLVYSKALAESLREYLGSDYHVELAMRYGSPSIAQAVHQLKKASCQDWVIAPLYPQYAKSTTESSWQALSQKVSQLFSGVKEPSIHELKPFYDAKHYIAALTQVTAEALEGRSIDHLLMSYHGLPERHLSSAVCSVPCDKKVDLCPAMTPSNKNCYRAQCYASSRALAQELGFSDSQYTVSFQSRLGRTPWIGPDTEVVIEKLYEQGVRKLAVVMPAFVVDCLETLEEVGIRLRKQWLLLGETEFVLIPCLNAHPSWVKSLGHMVKESYQEICERD